MAADKVVGINVVPFVNQQAIVKFTLSDGTNALNPTALTIDNGLGDDYPLTLTIPASTYITNGNGVLYVAIPEFSGETVTLTATCGVTKDVPHPYLSQRVTAQQMIDGVKYGLALYQKVAKESQTLLPMKSDWRSFCMGYSQGGAVSLATHREIEEQGLADELHFQGSICGDGPYDLVSTMRYYLEDDGTSYGVETSHRKGLATIPAVVPLILKGMVETHPDLAAYKIADLLSQQLLDTGVLGWIDSKAYNLDNISLKWYEQLQVGVDTLGRQYTPAQMAEMFDSPKVGKVWGKMEKMFSPAVYAYMSDASNFNAVPEVATNVGQALHRALADNSVITGWEPKHRIQFFHSKTDVIVPYGNYLSFRDAHPQGEGTLFRINDTFSASDHMDAGAALLMEMLTLKSYGAYFNWLCEGSTTSVSEELRVKSEEFSTAGAWYDMQGRRLSGKPSQKGIYIHQGKKVIMK